MRMFFRSPILSPWALRPSASHMFTHIARYRKLTDGTNKLISQAEHQRQSSDPDAHHCQQLTERLQDCVKLFQEVLEKKDKQLQKMQKETEQLRIKTSPGYMERMKLSHILNVRGALERIVFQAPSEGVLEKKYKTQAGLDELAKNPEVNKILKKEAQERRLVYDDVKQCFPLLYHCVSTYAHCNDGIIVVRGQDFSRNQVAALIVLLKLQKDWPDPLEWREEPVEVKEEVDEVREVPVEEVKKEVGEEDKK